MFQVIGCPKPSIPRPDDADIRRCIPRKRRARHGQPDLTPPERNLSLPHPGPSRLGFRPRWLKPKTKPRDSRILALSGRPSHQFTASFSHLGNNPSPENCSQPLSEPQPPQWVCCEFRNSIRRIGSPHQKDRNPNKSITKTRRLARRQSHNLMIYLWITGQIGPRHTPAAG